MYAVKHNSTVTELMELDSQYLDFHRNSDIYTHEHAHMHMEGTNKTKNVRLIVMQISCFDKQ